MQQERIWFRNVQYYYTYNNICDIDVKSIFAWFITFSIPLFLNIINHN